MEFDQHERVSLNSNADLLSKSRKSGNTDSKFQILLAFLLLIVVVLGIIMYTRAQEPKRYDIAGLNDQ